MEGQPWQFPVAKKGHSGIFGDENGHAPSTFEPPERSDVFEALIIRVLVTPSGHTLPPVASQLASSLFLFLNEERQAWSFSGNTIRDDQKKL